MNLTPASMCQFGDEKAFLDFLGVHEVAHRTLARYAAARGYVIPAVPLADTPYNNRDWLLDHEQVHRSLAQASGRPLSGDLATVDLKDKSQFEDWMYWHAALHEQINLDFGVTV